MDLDRLVRQVLEARAELDARLGNERFPQEAFDELWVAVRDYRTAMKGLNWVHRDVAREMSGLREFLALEGFRTPGEALTAAERMECQLFSDRDQPSNACSGQRRNRG